MKILLFIWQLPQALLAKLLKVILRAKRTILYTDIDIPIYVYTSKVISCFALGTAIFIRDGVFTKNVVKHEYGHCLQSRILGPFYLLAVGLPSVILNLLSGRIKKVYDNYYNFYPENWADKLGGVKRK